VGQNDKLSAFRWSRFSEYLKPSSQRPSWLRVDRLLGEWGIPKDSPAGRHHFERMMETRRMSDDPHEVKKIERGWCYGSEDFRQELLQQMESSFGHHHDGVEKQQSAEAKAQRILSDELKQRKIRTEELEKLKKGDPLKVKMAFRLRQETTMTWDWIAQQLAMGADGCADSAVRRYRSKNR
jgi:hypothetical protein